MTWSTSALRAVLALDLRHVVRVDAREARAEDPVSCHGPAPVVSIGPCVSWLHGPMAAVRFVDVFSDSECRGNALAVFHDADDLSDEQMATIARWTNLSETTFLCAPTVAGADYRVRIWTTGGELPFAGHPTLGSAHAWLEAGGVPASDEVVVQECAAGLVPVRRGERLAFAAPPLTRSGPVEPPAAARVVDALGLDPADVLDLAWVDNGPGWVGIRLRSPDAVLAADPDPGRCVGLKAGLVASYPPGSRDDGVAAEVRAFYSDGRDFAEDPVGGQPQRWSRAVARAGRAPARPLRRGPGHRHRSRGPRPRRGRRRRRVGGRGDPHRAGRNSKVGAQVVAGETDLSARYGQLWVRRRRAWSRGP